MGIIMSFFRYPKMFYKLYDVFSDSSDDDSLSEQELNNRFNVTIPPKPIQEPVITTFNSDSLYDVRFNTYSGYSRISQDPREPRENLWFEDNIHIKNDYYDPDAISIKILN